MALLFIHGVNNRNTDRGYWKFHNMRRSMIDTLVLKPLRKSLPKFDQFEDAYWGDLGVRFDFELASIPDVDVVQHLGGDVNAVEIRSLQDFPSLIYLLEKSGKDSLPALLSGTDSSIVFSALVEPLLISEVRDSSVLIAEDIEEAEHLKQDEDIKNQGAAQSYLIRASEKLAANQEFLSGLKNAKTDEEFLGLFQAELVNTATDLASEEPDLVVKLTTLGQPALARIIDSSVTKLRDGIETVTSKVKDATLGKALRAGSLAALEWQRLGVSKTALHFVGDVFEYLKRGWSNDADCITERVARKIFAAYKQSKDNNEPFVVVTHSFGSMIFFDLMNSYKFEEPIKVDLWAMAGAQVSLFAEMRLFKNSERQPRKLKEFLSKPTPVEKWINFYDQTDLFSYLAEPVFGNKNVTDIEFKQNANLVTAHGDYFAQPAFYAKLLSEIPIEVAAKSK